MEAGRAVDFVGCAPGNCLTTADAEQAYVQADLKGKETWVALPEEAWPDDWWDKTGSPLYDRPVVRLYKALYGHPQSGSFWEDHCDERVQKAGFVPVGPSWPSCYVHPKLGLFLTIYVDDFKMAGPKGNIEEGWSRLRKGLKIEPHKYLEDGRQMYLGCSLEKSVRKLADGKVATFFDYVMEDYLKQTVALYLDLAGPGVKLRHVDTPFVHEDQTRSPQGAPASDGPVVECPWCCHTFPPVVHENLRALE